MFRRWTSPRGRPNPDEGDAESQAKARDLRCQVKGACPEPKDADYGTVDPPKNGGGKIVGGGTFDPSTSAPIRPPNKPTGKGGLKTGEWTGDFEGQGGTYGAPDSR